MSPRFKEGKGDVTRHLQPLVDDDEYLTALSEGKDLSGGEDDLAALLLELRGEIETDVPAAPEVDGADDTIADLSPARARRRGPGPWLSGLIGAAAATVVVVSVGSALYNASPGAALWGPSKAVFGDRTAVVELASTLDELETANENGDTEAVRRLFTQARSLLGSLNAALPAERTYTTKTHAPSPSDSMAKATVTVTDTVPSPEPALAVEGSATSEPNSKDHDTAPTASVLTQTVTAPAPVPASRSTQSPQPATSQTTTSSKAPDTQPPTSSSQPTPLGESDPVQGAPDRAPGF